MFTKMKFFCTSASFLICAVANGQTIDAEYAIRWESDTAVLKSIEEVSKLLGLNEFDFKDSDHEISYFDIKRPANVPDDFQIIARKRTTTKKNGKKENQITFKYRSKNEIDPKKWLCPLGAVGGGVVLEKKYEVDISFSIDAKPSKQYSLSCTLKSDEKQLDFPPELAVSERVNGKFTMKRRKIENIKREGISISELKIEEWRMASSKSTLIEVSMPGKESSKEQAGDQDKFIALVVKKLLEAKIKPSIANKTPTE